MRKLILIFIVSIVTLSCVNQPRKQIQRGNITENSELYRLIINFEIEANHATKKNFVYSVDTDKKEIVMSQSDKVIGRIPVNYVNVTYSDYEEYVLADTKYGHFVHFEYLEVPYEIPGSLILTDFEFTYKEQTEAYIGFINDIKSELNR